MMDARNDVNGSGRRMPTEQAVENMALAGVAAVQKLIADRDNLRHRLNAQEQNMTKLRAANDELNRNLSMIRDLTSAQEREIRNLRASNDELRGNLNRLRDQYMGLVNKFLTQLRHIDSSIRDAVHWRQEGQGEDSTVVSFVQRFAPNGTPNGGSPNGSDGPNQQASGY
jgi:cell division protein FtsB